MKLGRFNYKNISSERIDFDSAARFCQVRLTLAPTAPSSPGMPGIPAAPSGPGSPWNRTCMSAESPVPICLAERLFALTFDPGSPIPLSPGAPGSPGKPWSPWGEKGRDVSPMIQTEWEFLIRRNMTICPKRRCVRENSFHVSFLMFSSIPFVIWLLPLGVFTLNHLTPSSSASSSLTLTNLMSSSTTSMNLLFGLLPGSNNHTDLLPTYSSSSQSALTISICFSWFISKTSDTNCSSDVRPYSNWMVSCTRGLGLISVAAPHWCVTEMMFVST